jgi:flagellar FliL protein
VKISLELSTEEMLPEMDKKQPILRDILISVLSSKQIEEISTANGKSRLKEELMAAANKRLNDGEITNIFFADFVIQ